ncbi:elongation factor G [Bryobacter aggregatus]|uniref:elongation factor G n=1 Tax=Bryobacter aggregatus TaxID=360054 RepID=UPI0004E1A933|nr:elongation factor G [Bryobacter aggregatus]
MRVYPTSDIRNVALAGHAHAGKTMLASAMLFASGATSRLLRTEDGATITDFDEEEISRKHSISTGIAAFEFSRKKINLLDTPGLNTFIHDARLCLPAADAMLIVVDGACGVQVQTEKAWDAAQEFHLPVVFVVTKLDHERTNFTAIVDSIRERFGRRCCSLESKEELVEMIAEDDDELMQEFFEQGHLSAEHLSSGLKKELIDRKVFPILGVSAYTDLGVRDLLNFITESLPCPTDRMALNPKGPPGVFVFKTLADAFAGRVSYFKVMSGSLRNDGHLMNARTHHDERFAHLSTPFGKQANEIPELATGDIGVVSKLKETLTGDSLSDKSKLQSWPAVPTHEPAMAFAIVAKTRNDEDRLSVAMHKVLEEDPTLRFYRDPHTKEFLLAGNSQQHIEAIVARLRKRYNVDVELRSPKIPYLETVRGMADVQGRHKKQSGGHGQFGDCKIKVEPLARGQHFEFHNATFGGSVPKQYVPAIEKGIQEAAAHGWLAGYPMVDFKVTLYDGSYHDVDSNEMSFKMAGRKAFKAAMELAKPALLEPIMKVETYTPVEYAGDLLGDFTSRRGRVSGMEVNAGTQMIRAMVPMAEMLSYQNDLTAMTQGRATFVMELDHYDYVPQPQAEKIIAAANHTQMSDED